MADHLRKQLRDALVARLTGLTSTAARVFPGRVLPLQPAELPCLLVDTGDEQVTDRQFNKELQQREVQLRVRLVVKALDGYLDTLDEIAKQVEIALGTATTLGPASWWLYDSTTAPELAGEGERTVAQCVLTYRAQYLCTEATPDVAA